MKIGWKKVAASLGLVGVVAAMVCFLQEENKSEGKAVDELVSYTYGQKGR